MKILIGYDGSSYADAAVDDLRRAGLPSEVEALVVSVGDAPIVPPFASHEVIERALVGERVVSIVNHANRHVSEALKHANDLVLSVTLRLRSYFPSWRVLGEVSAGTPALELVRRAEEWEAQLLGVSRTLGNRKIDPRQRFVGGCHCRTLLCAYWASRTRATRSPGSTTPNRPGWFTRG